jgi:hypothetical protein
MAQSFLTVQEKEEEEESVYSTKLYAKLETTLFEVQY